MSGGGGHQITVGIRSPQQDQEKKAHTRMTRCKIRIIIFQCMRNKNMFLNQNSKFDLCIFFSFTTDANTIQKSMKVRRIMSRKPERSSTRKASTARIKTKAWIRLFMGSPSDRHSAEITHGDLHPTRSCPSFNVSLFLSLSI